MVKTFGEVIRDIKPDEVWTPINEDSRVKCIRRTNSDSNYLNGIMIEFDGEYNSCFLPFHFEFELQRKEVVFEEAIKAFKEGKEIESVVNGMKYKIESTGERVMYYNNEDGYATLAPNFSLKAIFGNWYIND